MLTECSALREIYFKLKDTIMYIQSLIPFQINLGSFHFMVNHILTVPLSKDTFNKEVNIIKTIATNNGYDEKVIDSLIDKKQKKLITTFNKKLVLHFLKKISFYKFHAVRN